MSLSASSLVSDRKDHDYSPSKLLSKIFCRHSSTTTTTTRSANNNVNNYNKEDDKYNKWTKRRRSRDTSTQQKEHHRQHYKLLHPVLNSSLVIINLVYLIICVSLITTIPCTTDALIVDPLLGDITSDSSSGGGGTDTSKSGASAGISMDDALNRFNMENQIAAIFSRVSYGSTTTKRSISDLGGLGQSSLTTIPTPFLTTNR